MSIFSIVSLETWVAIGFFVLAPTIAAMMLRGSLNRRLKDLNKKVSRLLISGEAEGIQPDLIQQLKARYQQASQRLEHINTIALIESVYQNERITFLGFKRGCDQVDSFTRIVPNLLMAFGLIGTFWGITSNLTNISTAITTVSQSNYDFGKLVQELRNPLRDMGVAFSTSLFGLICGSTLTVINSFCNTGLGKEQLISSLEDYLDNVYKPTVEGNTRLDKAVDRMVKQQEEFLLRFHENVGKALEQSFGRAANQIAQECSRINQVAERVYTNFADAAGTISTGAKIFQQSVNRLENATLPLSNIVAEFKSGVAEFKMVADQIEENSIIRNLDRVLADFTTTQHSFTDSTQVLQTSLSELVSGNKTAAELAKKVYESWQNSTSQIITASETISTAAVAFQSSITSLESQTQTVANLVPELKTGLDTFAAAANKIKTNNIIKHLNTLVENLDATQSKFAISAQNLSIDVQETTNNHRQSIEMAERVYQGLEKITSNIQSGSQSFNDATHLLVKASGSFEQMSDKWQVTQIEFNNSTVLFGQAIQGINYLKPTIMKLDQVADSLQQVGLEVAKASRSNIEISESTQTAITKFDHSYQQVLSITDSSLRNLSKTNQSNWQDLINILESNSQYQKRSGFLRRERN